MDFFQIGTKETRGGILEVFPDFFVRRSKDFMVKGRSFYAIWDEEKNLWSTDEYELRRLVDTALSEFAKAQEAKGVTCSVKYLESSKSNEWAHFRKFLNNISDNSHQLDNCLTFSNTEVKKTDYVSRRLPYPLAPGDHSAWDELVGTLYSEEERAKIEWAIGAVISGDSKKLQKFLVFYGPGGTGKSTVMNVIYNLFGGLVSEGGYVTTFEAKSLVGSNNNFATEPFKANPLVAIQHDGDLSKIEDNSKLNSIISHEDMTINEKFKPSYSTRINAFLFMGTNKPVRISDAKSGIIRRLIDVHPTGELIEPDRYHALMSQIDFELGAIAHHCLEVYRKMGRNYYNTYRPIEMMLQTDVFFNYIETYYDIFDSQHYTTLKQAWELYKEFCKDSQLDYSLPQYKFRSELRNYFDTFKDRTTIDGNTVRSVYSGFNARPFKVSYKNESPFSLSLLFAISLLDALYMDKPAQYAKEDGTPEQRWSIVETVLSDLDTSKLHYLKVPRNHIVIDFDLKDDSGEKSLQLNLEAASLWPTTYAELSKSGSGVHLHYIYDGDVDTLAPVYSEGIEVKVYRGNSSLRRKLTKCNNIPVATINSGLPVKEAKVLNVNSIQSERGLRDLIGRNLRKEIHPGTKPSIDFINKILNDAYASGMVYDVNDLRPKLIAFANNSSNQAIQCLKIVQKMKFAGEETHEAENPKGLLADAVAATPVSLNVEDDRIVFFDVEVFEDLFVVCWKFRGSPNVVRMINPTAQEIESLFKLKLVGFYNRRYDNHILYARYIGYDNKRLYELSQKLINGSGSTAMFSAAFDISFADIYDFSVKRQGLKKWEIELGIHHMELNIPWDKPVGKQRWSEVVDYCVNDVQATEEVFEACYQDFVARQILAALSGLTVNHTTLNHAAKIFFGDNRNPQKEFVYTDLSEEFPGYVYDMGKSTYRGEVVGEGGYVYAEPGIYQNVALLDVASMHPTSIQELNLFGSYTPKFVALKEARLAIKRGDFDSARKMFDGRLAPFLGDKEKARALSDALKLVINSVYGLTSAKFDNPFRDIRNKDNIVAKRGALFMVDLKNAVQAQGYTVAHIKTDSIKIPDATPEIIEFVMKFGDKYGYTFEHETTYDKFCLVNDAVYIARSTEYYGDKWTVVDDGSEVESYTGFVEGKEATYSWTAVGAQFQHPYVFKTLFSGEDIMFKDLCETKQVTKGAMYLDFEHDRPMALHQGIQGMRFVGRTGSFVPVKEEAGGAALFRVQDEKTYAVTGTKGYFWLEAEMIKDKLERTACCENLVHHNDDLIDMMYFERLADEARRTIEKFGSFEEFVA